MLCDPARCVGAGVASELTALDRALRIWVSPGYWRLVGGQVGVTRAGDGVGCSLSLSLSLSVMLLIGLRRWLAWLLPS